MGDRRTFWFSLRGQQLWGLVHFLDLFQLFLEGMLEARRVKSGEFPCGLVAGRIAAERAIRWGELPVELSPIDSGIFGGMAARAGGVYCFAMEGDPQRICVRAWLCAADDADCGDELGRIGSLGNRVAQVTFETDRFA